jgi:alpha-glucosidase
MHPRHSELWHPGVVLYELNPLSFCDSNGDGFGDIRGIISKLDYLRGTTTALGVGALSLMPIYSSPMADWGYDVADQTAIDPRFGTMEDFDDLAEGVHGRGMRLVMDFVALNTSITHPWFEEARRSLDSEKRDWYIWADSKNGKLPNNWLSMCGRSAWTLDSITGQYYMHTYLPEEPDLNWRNPELRAEMLKVMRFWLDKGVDGFRIPGLISLLKDRQLRDDPDNPDYKEGESKPRDRYLRLHSGGQLEVKDVAEAFCSLIGHKPEEGVLADIYLDAPALNQVFDVCARHPAHGSSHLDLTALKWSVASFRSFIDEYEAMMGQDAWPSYTLGRADKHRLVSRFGEDKSKLLGMMQLTLRGMPVIYFGDELGLPDGKVPKEQARALPELSDPNCDLGHDYSRTPMPWNSDREAGFTSGTPWLPIDGKARSLSVEIQQAQPDSMLSMYKQLIHLRRTSPALGSGEYRSIDTGNDEVFGYLREHEMQRYLVILNFSSRSQVVSFHGRIGSWVAGTHTVDGDGRQSTPAKIELTPYEGRVFETRRETFK